MFDELEDEHTARSQDAGHLGDRRARVVEMVDHAHADRGVERGVGEGEVEGVALHGHVPGVVAEAFPGRGQLDARQIEEHNLAVPAVLIGEAPEARADLDEPVAGPGEKRLERDPIASILVRPARPEAVPIAQIGIGGVGHRRREGSRVCVGHHSSRSAAPGRIGRKSNGPTIVSRSRPADCIRLFVVAAT